jgi:hypothetical protein
MMGGMQIHPSHGRGGARAHGFLIRPYPAVSVASSIAAVALVTGVI